RCYTVCDDLRRIELREHLACLVLIRWRAACKGKIIWRKGDEPFQRQPSRHIADMFVKSAVLVDDDDGSDRAGCLSGPHQIALHFAIAARIGNVLALDAAVVCRNLPGPGGICRQERNDGSRRRARACQLRELVHETATIKGEMRVLVIRIDHRLSNQRPVHALPPSPMEATEYATFTPGRVTTR